MSVVPPLVRDGSPIRQWHASLPLAARSAPRSMRGFITPLARGWGQKIVVAACQIDNELYHPIRMADGFDGSRIPKIVGIGVIYVQIGHELSPRDSTIAVPQ